MGIFGGKKHKPSLNGLTTPTDDRTSLPTGWEFGHVIDRSRHVEKCDKSTQVNIPKSPPPAAQSPSSRLTEDKIVYKKEPVGIVHPYKDDIKMRPISRILDKKLVTLDTKTRDGFDSEDRKSEPDEPRRTVEAVKSLSLESLLDAMHTEQYRNKQHPVRGNSAQYESIQHFVNGLHQSNGGVKYHSPADFHRHAREDARHPKPCPSSRGVTSADSTNRKLPPRPVNHQPCRKASLPDENEYLTSSNQHCMSRIQHDLSHDRAAARASTEHRSHPSSSQRYDKNYIQSNHNNPAVRHTDRYPTKRPHPADKSHNTSGVNQQSAQPPTNLGSRNKAEPCWIENMLHTHQGGHPSIPPQTEVSPGARVTSRSHDQISMSNEQREVAEKPRRHSEARGRRQPGHTHKWVLDNNTTLLESTL